MVRARASHARGRRFEPCRIHQNTPFRHCRFGVFFVALFRQGERVGAALREQSVFAPLYFVYAFFGRKQTIDYRLAGRASTGASPVESTKTPRFGIAVSGCFLIRFSISFTPYKKRRTKSTLPFVRRYILFILPKTAFILRRRLRRRVLRRRSRRNVRRCRLRRGTCRRLWVSGGTSPIRTTIAAWN